jgi:hypothetical protein
MNEKQNLFEIRKEEKTQTGTREHFAYELSNRFCTTHDEQGNAIDRESIELDASLQDVS